MNDNITLPRSVVEHVMYHLNRGDADAVCWADGVIKPALDQPQVEQEPVASLADAIRAEPTELIRKWRVLELIKDHTRPQPKPLTVEQIDGIINDLDPIFLDTPTGFEEDFCRAVERAHGIGGEA